MFVLEVDERTALRLFLPLEEYAQLEETKSCAFLCGGRFSLSHEKKVRTTTSNNESRFQLVRHGAQKSTSDLVFKLSSIYTRVC